MHESGTVNTSQLFRFLFWMNYFTRWLVFTCFCCIETHERLLRYFLTYISYIHFSKLISSWGFLLVISIHWDTMPVCVPCVVWDSNLLVNLLYFIGCYVSLWIYIFLAIWIYTFLKITVYSEFDFLLDSHILYNSVHHQQVISEEHRTQYKKAPINQR